MESRRPFVSVLVPTYNRRLLLEKTLESLRKQDYPDFEVLVCDDSSSDGTFEFLQSLEKDWPRLKAFRNEVNLNFNGTLQRLFSLATGELIGMQHDHDLYKPQFLSRMVELLSEHPGAGFGCAAYDLIDTEERLVLNPPLPECRIFRGGILAGPEFVKTLAYSRYTPIAAMSTVFRRDALERAGGYKTEWYLASDEDLYRRMGSVADIAFCPEPIFVMRLRPAERQKILGSWKSIYTLFLFRTSTASLLDDRTGGSRRWATARQFFFKWKAMFEESMSLWLRGEAGQLRLAGDLSLLPPLPTQRKALNWMERCILSVFIAGLSVTVRLGKQLNRARKAKQQK